MHTKIVSHTTTTNNMTMEAEEILAKVIVKTFTSKIDCVKYVNGLV